MQREVVGAVKLLARQELERHPTQARAVAGFEVIEKGQGGLDPRPLCVRHQGQGVGEAEPAAQAIEHGMEAFHRRQGVESERG